MSIQRGKGDFCIVIPAYNAGATLGVLINKLVKLNLATRTIIVDDGSSDDTYIIAQKMGLKIIRHPQNYGKGAALLSGFNYCKNRTEFIVTMDADNQHEPANITLLLEALHDKNSDILIGKRSVSIKYMPLARFFSNYLTSLIVSIRAGQKIIDSQCGFRAIRSRILRNTRLETRHFETESELLIKASICGFKIDSFPINTVYSKSAKSSIRPLVDTLRFIRLIIKSLFW